MNRGNGGDDANLGGGSSYGTGLGGGGGYGARLGGSGDGGDGVGPKGLLGASSKEDEVAPAAAVVHDPALGIVCSGGRTCRRLRRGRGRNAGRRPRLCPATITDKLNTYAVMKFGSKRGTGPGSWIDVGHVDLGGQGAPAHPMATSMANPIPGIHTSTLEYMFGSRKASALDTYIIMKFGSKEVEN